MFKRRPNRLFPLACIVLLAASAVCAEPENHAAFMANGEYREAFDAYSATLREARSRLDPKDFAAVEKAVMAEVKDSAKADVSAGASEAEAWSAAYAAGSERLNREMKWDWLRRNPEGVQGFYRMRSKAFEGWLAVEKGDEPDLYAVQIFAVRKRAPRNIGELDGFGILTGNVMQAAYKHDDGNSVSITFTKDTATIAEPKAFKESGRLGAGVSFDGEFVREKK